MITFTSPGAIVLIKLFFSVEPNKSRGYGAYTLSLYLPTLSTSDTVELGWHQAYDYAGLYFQLHVSQYLRLSKYSTLKTLCSRKDPQDRSCSLAACARLPRTESSAEGFIQQNSSIIYKTSSQQSLPCRRYAGVTKRLSSSAPAFALRMALRISSLPRICAQQKSRVSASQVTSSEKRDREYFIRDDNAERSFKPEDEEHNDQLSSGNYSDRATQEEDLAACDDHFGHSDIRTDVGDQRRLYNMLNPVSEYQANLEAVSPECKDLFTQCCPAPVDQSNMEDEDDSVDPYWTWSREKQQWFHVDDESSTTIWFPKDFD
ncbi:hypothetical protein F5B20DRAFT_143583 [Whalleya microplaca]|nr:hypothetical protein F5B20DRAFT_143583 [Whalleya microplaca]